MKLDKLKVRPKKNAAAAPCAAEFATMLACWASSSDLNNVGACKDSAKALQECMASRVSRRPHTMYIPQWGEYADTTFFCSIISADSYQ